MSINRAAAIEYAKTYWNRACDDELIGIKTDHVSVAAKRRLMNAPVDKGWIPYFRSDGKSGENAIFGHTVNGQIEYQDRPFLTDASDNLNDCTHYISRCLAREGIKIKQTFGANELITSFVDNARSDASILAERVDKDTGQKIVNSGVFRPGDLVGYWLAKENRYHHSAMMVAAADPGKGFAGGITCHSNCRFSGLTKRWNGEDDDDWYLGPDSGPYTLIHFTADDPTLPTGSPLGWWKLGDNYYFISGDRTAKATSVAPRSARATLHHAHDHAALFRAGGDTLFLWTTPKGGKQLEFWSPIGTGKQSTVVRTERGPMEAVQVF